MPYKARFRRFRPLLIQLSRGFFALAITSLISQFSFDYLESFTYDLRIRIAPALPAFDQIELVVIDSQTIKTLGHAPTAVEFQSLLEALNASGAKTIISLVSPSEFVGSTEESEALAKTASQLPDFHVAVDDVPMAGEPDALKLPSPFESIHVASAPVPIDRNIFAKDDVSRRMILAYQGRPTMYPLIANSYKNTSAPYSPKYYRGTFDYLQSDQAYVRFSPAHSYSQTGFATLLNSPNDIRTSKKFKDKIVIIGRDIQTTSKDYVRTPFSRDIVAMTVVELTANSLATLIRNDAPVRLPKWANTVITGLIAYFTVLVVLIATPTTGLILLGMTLLLYFTLATLVLWFLGLWIAVAQPFLAIFICYYFFIPYRLIIENRRSWEYYQKNRLLTQVEELKTNFLSMMSHDLKTPIARIQGMVDIIASDPKSLSNIQTEAIHTLRRSSTELLEFVSAVLSLGRIEAKAIQLHMSSKDLNSLIEEVVEKLEYLAKTKGITIRTELDPLFSIRMDVDLIKQVLQNLIENAIKYSPEESSVLISTEEGDNSLIIQIADQGPGIADEELPNIFMKFYRSRNAKSSSIKGSGLGLYLAKYFVELHKGQISVDSHIGQGTTFTIELPTK